MTIGNSPPQKSFKFSLPKNKASVILNLRARLKNFVIFFAKISGRLDEVFFTQIRKHDIAFGADSQKERSRIDSHHRKRCLHHTLVNISPKFSPLESQFCGGRVFVLGRGAEIRTIPKATSNICMQGCVNRPS